jgi:hypothetical protein
MLFSSLEEIRGIIGEALHKIGYDAASGWSFRPSSFEYRKMQFGCFSHPSITEILR